MFNKTVKINELNITSKQDLLHTTVLVPIDRDYHGDIVYEHKTVWACIHDYNVFTNYLNELTNDEIIKFEDDLGGNILSGIAESNAPLEFFGYIADRVGGENFYKMLLTKNRAGLCPLAKIQNLQSFAILLNDISIDRDSLRQICRTAPNDIVQHLSNMINAVDGVELMNNNALDENEFL